MQAVGQHAAVYFKLGGPSKQGVTRLAAERRKPQIISDVRETKEWQAAMKEAVDCTDAEYQLLLNSFHSEIAFPLFGFNKNLIAVINLHHSAKNGLSQRSLRVLRRLFKGASRAIENSLPYEVAMESAGWLKEMHDAIHRIREQSEGASAERRSLYDLIVEEGARFARAGVVGMWMSHEPTSELHIAAITAVTASGYSAFRCPVSQGIRGIVFRSAQPYYCDDTGSDQNWFECIPGIRSCYVVPVQHNNKVVGVLCFDSFRTQAFAPGLREALNAFGELCSLLISKTIAEIESLVAKQCQVSMPAATGEPDLYRRTVDLACGLVGGEGASLFLIPSGSKSLKLVFTSGLAPGYNKDTDYPLDDGAGITPWVAVKGVPLRLKNCGDKKELLRWDSGLRWKGRTREIRSRRGFWRPLLLVPIFDGKILIGVLRVSGKKGQAAFLEEDKVALMELVKMLAVEMHRPRATLSSLTDEIGSVWSDRKASLDLILERSMKLSEADAGTIFELDGDSLVNLGWRGDLILSRDELTHTVHACLTPRYSARPRSTCLNGPDTWHLKPGA